MKNKRAFTLVELISIIVLLSIIFLLVLPGIKSSIASRKQTQYENMIKTIESAAKLYYTDNSDTTKIYLSTLVDNDYLSSGIKDPRTGEDISGCVYIYLDNDGYNIYTYMSDMNNCSASQLYYSLVVKPEGGVYSNTTNNTSYQLLKDAIVEVKNPTRTGYGFGGWNYSCIDCTIANEQFTMGTSNVVLEAKWTPNTYTLTTNLDGGTISNTPPSTVAYKGKVDLDTPTKSGYTFIRWDVITGGDSESVISDNTLTMGYSNTTIKAIFEKNVWKKTTYTCNRTPGTLTVTTNTCARTFTNYTRIAKKCNCSGTTCSFSTITDYPSSCVTGSSFTCDTSHATFSYVVTCASNYNYYFNTTTATGSTCSVEPAISCNSSTLNNSYISACEGSVYNYAFTTSTEQTNQCTAGSSFTCDSPTYQSSYVSSCEYTG